MKKSENIDSISLALSKLHGLMQNAPVDSKNPHFKNDYASLESVINVSRKLLSQCELAIVQSPNLRDDKLVLTTLLSHKSGQWLESDCPLFVDANKMQSLGSAISYARRYSWSAFLGITQEDDDGESANAPKPVAQAAPKPIAKAKEALPVVKAKPEPKKEIWNTLTNEFKMSEGDAIEWLRGVSGKENSKLWTDEDIAKIYKAISQWKP